MRKSMDEDGSYSYDSPAGDYSNEEFSGEKKENIKEEHSKEV